MPVTDHRIRTLALWSTLGFAMACGEPEPAATPDAATPDAATLDAATPDAHAQPDGGADASVLPDARADRRPRRAG